MARKIGKKEEESRSTQRRKAKQKDIELISCIMQARRDLNIANKNFESAEAELIDYYSYQIKASKSKLDYFIKRVKEKGIVMDAISELEFRTYQNKVV